MYNYFLFFLNDMVVLLPLISKKKQGSRDVIRSQAIVVIGGVDMVYILWVILRLLCAPCIDRGRLQ
jgi:Cu/Ag efflux pump CusA